MKYKVGDEVRVKSLNELKNNPWMNFEGRMDKYCGRNAKVVEIVEEGVYRLNIDKGDYCGEGWDWSENMLEDAYNKSINGKFDLTNHLRTNFDPPCALSDQRLYDACISTLILDLDSDFPFHKEPKSKHSINLIGEHKFLTLKVRS